MPALENRVDSLTGIFAQSLTDCQQQLNALLVDTAESLRCASTEINEKLSTSLTTAQRGLYESIEQMVTRTEQQVMRLDDAMEDELTKALKNFGYQMTSLSEKFVSDYIPLTDKLRDLVRLAEHSEKIDNEDQRIKRSRITAQ